MGADLSALGAQMLRLAEGGVPSAERASAELVTPEQCFRWLVEAARRFGDDAFQETRAALRGVAGTRGAARTRTPPETVPQLLPYVGDGQPMHYWRHLPEAADRDLDAYLARVTPRIGGRELGFQVPDLQSVNWDAFGRFTQVVTPLLLAFGPRRARFNCFFGSYRRTPFGAHVDAHHLHSFQYVVQGQKRLRAWDTADLVRRFGESSIVEFYRTEVTERRALPATPAIPAGPGDLLYWPGGHTHCLESDGPSVGLSIVVDSEAVRLWDGSRSPLPWEVKARGWTAMPGRAAVERRLARIAKQAGRRSTATAVLLELILDASGRAVAPAPERLRGPRLAMTDVLESLLTPAFRILHVVDDARLVMAVHGHGSEWTHARSIPDVTRLLSFLDRTASFRVRDVVRKFATPRRFSRADVALLLRFFVSAGAFRLQPRESEVVRA